MKSIRKTLLFVSAVVGMSLIVFPVAAQIAPVTGEDNLGINTGNSAEDAENFISNVINIALGFVGLVAAGFLIYGGAMYITSAGDDSKAEKAKKTILYAIIGLVVIGLAAAIVNFVITGLGGEAGGGDAGGGDQGGNNLRPIN